MKTLARLLLASSLLLAGCSAPTTDESTDHSKDNIDYSRVDSAWPPPAATPHPDAGPCDPAKLKGDRDAAVALMPQRGSTEVMGAFSRMMNDENDCAQSLNDNAPEQQKHNEAAGEAALYMAVYGPDMFGSKKTDLQTAVTFEQGVVDSGQADDATQKAAQDVLDSAKEKLAALQ
jgi:hypothetical protein